MFVCASGSLSDMSGFTSEGFPSSRAITNGNAESVYFQFVLVPVIPSVKYVFYICFLQIGLKCTLGKLH